MSSTTSRSSSLSAAAVPRALDPNNSTAWGGPATRGCRTHPCKAASPQPVSLDGVTGHSPWHASLAVTYDKPCCAPAHLPVGAKTAGLSAPLLLAAPAMTPTAPRPAHGRPRPGRSSRRRSFRRSGTPRPGRRRARRSPRRSRGGRRSSDGGGPALGDLGRQRDHGRHHRGGGSRYGRPRRGGPASSGGHCTPRGPRSE